ncbi:PilW family protein [Lysobacter enzymogenes]|uniref:Type IV pilus assembly protein PilW n=1 Tax=Lysobacter enzymogenes TaxID=69 RepID=A0AAU9APV8_LYSEN|nr:PilW family protein [Lysobacter enzymogenes]BAV96991.1 type IV pilus assembly protein PilW [Lysobacter enzymogenes]
MNTLRPQNGLSLIELMIALVIGSLLMLGLVQVFSASRAAYQLSEGLARVQENARFAIDYMQRDLRMVGHLGCVSDQTRFMSTPAGFHSAFVAQTRPSEAQLAAAPEPIQFHVSVQGFEATGTGPGGAVTLPASGAWSGAPALPDYIKNLVPAPAAGSDIVVVRYFSGEGAPLSSYTSGASTALTVDKAHWDMALAPGIGASDPAMFGVADCVGAVAFQASQIENAGGSVKLTVNQSGLNQSSLITDNFALGQAMLYRAVSEAFYIASRPDGTPGLYRARFGSTAGGTAMTPQVEELVRGIENMQLIYGMDSQTDPGRAPTGFIASQMVADKVQTGSSTLPWRRVGLIQVALMSRANDPSSAIAPSEIPRLLGVQVAPPADSRYRAVYETTIAMRNRLYGN